MAKNHPGRRILQVAPSDTLGGAQKVAWNLHLAYRSHGHRSWLAVGNKCSDDPDVLEIPRARKWENEARPIWKLHERLQPLEGRIAGVGYLQRLLRIMARGWPGLEYAMGWENFNFPGSRQLLNLPPLRPDVIHAHNLHGGYFDLRFLKQLSAQVPVFLTLHDAWLLSGHCAHSFNCERWRTGCGDCPDLTIYNPVRRDATGHNWRRKRRIYASCRLNVATPCHWLMQKVEQSILAPAIVESRVIPNGIDLSIYQPADNDNVRSFLNIAPDARVLLFYAKSIYKNMWKDYRTLRDAIALVADHLNGHDLLLLAMGKDSPPEQVGRAKLRFIPYQDDPGAVARYYQAADVYIHAARADTFPNSVIEAMACGKPVVATAVGGIPEQIADGETGFLVPPGDAQAISSLIEHILSDDDLRRQIGQAAAESARRRYALQRMVDDYLKWYENILTNWEQQTHVLHR